MAYQLTSVSACSRSLRRTFATKEEALAYAEQIAYCIDEDPDNPGYFDIFTKGGDVVSLVPVS